MGRTAYREAEEPVDGLRCASGTELAARVLSAECGQHLDIDQYGCKECLVAQACSCHFTASLVIGQCGDEHAGVNDCHGRP